MLDGIGVDHDELAPSPSADSCLAGANREVINLEGELVRFDKEKRLRVLAFRKRVEQRDGQDLIATGRGNRAGETLVDKMSVAKDGEIHRSRNRCKDSLRCVARFMRGPSKPT